MKQGAGYPIKANGEHKFKFKGNWKIQLENTTDLYHFPVVHKSWMKSIDDETAAVITSFMTSEDAFCRSLGNGHSLAVLVPEIVDLDRDDGAPLPDRFNELAAQLSQKHTPEEVRRIVRSLMGVGFNLNLFPNLALSMAFFRVLRPFRPKRRRFVTSRSPWTAAPTKRTACACAFTNTFRARSASVALTTPKPGNACSAAHMPALTYRSSSTAV